MLHLEDYITYVKISRSNYFRMGLDFSFLDFCVFIGLLFVGWYSAYYYTELCGLLYCSSLLSITQLIHK